MLSGLKRWTAGKKGCVWTILVEKRTEILVYLIYVS